MLILIDCVEVKLVEGSPAEKDREDVATKVLEAKCKDELADQPITALETVPTCRLQVEGSPSVHLLTFR